jgi:hypothetical protein
MKHALVRTSPKGPGKPFLGTCTICGRKNLTVRESAEECDNPRGLSEGEALGEVIDAVGGES